MKCVCYSFNILQDVYTHNGGVHVHRILTFIKYSQNDEIRLSNLLARKLQN
jgi:hypothetical protein